MALDGFVVAPNRPNILLGHALHGSPGDPPLLQQLRAWLLGITLGQFRFDLLEINQPFPNSDHLFPECFGVYHPGCSQ
ncbi:hypothetical protein SBA4_6670003 [Candidatus Sulfopaludibacter sp. SbA4]|nr:hypothetical protein SBA4_6670003 [Candidatus Sulfopaludibacter sp. SbA4]